VNSEWRVNLLDLGRAIDLVSPHLASHRRRVARMRHLLAAWAAYHHERLDGTGYPFHLTENDLCMSARIMAISDVFTALTEDRPYREGMDSTGALEILSGMAENASLDGRLVELLRANRDEIDAIRSGAQAEARAEYVALFPTLTAEPPADA